ncbi:hypothetical protein E0H75_38940 [Kribbella capetownensis]|uniref:Beta-glucocerebrosidase 2-like protein n=1 Tax=Kribbella capetownensis TaxID=1572659 RepID=A0A4V2M5K0_9ACTN|nr:GH116 family glycosyl hydrolase [Kribbella capetownensis]TCC40052.1 hypothetical protein E0H75_38940 [Kribbella capetownensis]
MDHTPDLSECSNPACGGSCPRAGVGRRTFLSISAAGVGMLAAPGMLQTAQAITRMPALTPERIAELTDRGTPTEYTCAALAKIGMPVGGGCAGQVYLSGDGRLWAWDVSNALTFPLGGADFAGTHYAVPLSADADGATRFRQGFVLRVGGQTRTVDAKGFDDVRFTGQYPLGRVSYKGSDSPVDVTLEAFSPFVPLATADSTLPATIMAFTLHNTSAQPVEATLLGYSENPVCLDSRRSQPTTQRATAYASGIEWSAADPAASSNDDILFEEWDSDTYDGWTATGDAFGTGPVRPADTPPLMQRFGDLNISGSRFVTSYNFRLSGGPDDRTGTLTSTPFEITRRYVAVALGGGNHPGKVCVNVVVDGAVVATATGSDSEPLVGRMLDIGEYEGRTAQIQLVDSATGAWAHLNCGSITFTDRADIVFEDWERTDYTGWTVTGTAFGAGPVTVAETPENFRRPFGNRTELNVSGSRFVTSYDFRSGSYDSPQGSLTSRVFTIDRAYITVWTGGGSNPDTTVVNLLVDGEVVASANGSDIEPLDAICWAVGPWAGRSAQLQIVDRSSGGWGHVNVDRIIFSDRPIRRQPVADRTDAGSFTMATLDKHPVVRRSVAAWSTPDELFDAADGPAEVDGAATQVGTVAVKVALRPGESRTVRFVQGWFFPTPERRLFSSLVGGSTLMRHYSTRFGSARQVAQYVGTHIERLESGTREWVRTWYDDSTLPHWFLERTLATVSTLATGTCHRWQDGRFYAWEGTYCCSGTCEHVWNYAQAIARLFPDLERDTRERVDLGIAYKPTGEIGNRGESPDASSSFADGHCGTILRIYREHQMSRDSAFLTRVWPKVKVSVDYLVSARDGSDQDGIFRGGQWNTLDTEWFGEIPWLSGLYVAALRAAAAMATEMGDGAAASKYTTIANRGSAYLNGPLWDQTYGYYVHKVDPAHPVPSTNRGVFVDQLYGQTYAAQLGLPRVFEAGKARTALTSVYRNNFQPNPSAYRPPGIGTGRVYSTDGEAGTVMVAWPNGGSTESGGHPYFNEVWTGQEHQFAAHLFAEGMAAEGLAVTRAVYDRYHGEKRNPYNEIEASDHYARAMMSFGTYLAACGYEYHGPRGHLGFAPRLTPEDFACAFTGAEGWGRYSQTRGTGTQTAVLDIRHGRVRLNSLSFETARPATAVTVKLNGKPHPATLTTTGTRTVITLTRTALVTPGKPLTITLTTE